MMCLLKSNCGNSRVSRPTQSKEFMLVTRQLYLVCAFISVGHSVLQVREPITFRPGKLIELDDLPGKSMRVGRFLGQDKALTIRFKSTYVKTRDATAL